MSNVLSALSNDAAQSVTLGSVLGKGRSSPSFQARFADGQAVPRSAPKPEPRDDGPAIDPVDQIRADAFAQGFDEGMRVASESMSVDHDVMEHLAESLAQIAPAAQGALSALLSSAVLRIVTQVVGEVEIDAALLARRVEGVAAFIEEEQGRKSLHVHPDDMALLTGHQFGFDLTPDPELNRGCVRLDTAEGWIEDGPDVQLARLKAMLDTMEGH